MDQPAIGVREPTAELTVVAALAATALGGLVRVAATIIAPPTAEIHPTNRVRAMIGQLGSLPYECQPYIAVARVITTSRTCARPVATAPSRAASSPRAD